MSSPGENTSHQPNEQNPTGSIGAGECPSATSNPTSSLAEIQGFKSTFDFTCASPFNFTELKDALPSNDDTSRREADSPVQQLDVPKSSNSATTFSSSPFTFFKFHSLLDSATLAHMFEDPTLLKQHARKWDSKTSGAEDLVSFGGAIGLNPKKHAFTFSVSSDFKDLSQKYHKEAQSFGDAAGVKDFSFTFSRPVSTAKHTAPSSSANSGQPTTSEHKKIFDDSWENC